MSIHLLIGLFRIVSFTVLMLQTSNAMVCFVSNEQLVRDSQHIIIAEVNHKSDINKTQSFGETKVSVENNELKVMKSIKGSLKKGEVFTMNRLKFDGWMEDNVELPSKGSKVLLFLTKDKDGNLKPVNGIQGVWKIYEDGKSNYGSIEEIREIVQQQSSCIGKDFTDLVGSADLMTQAGRYSKALEAYRKAYHICPMKDLEEQMAWLMGEVGDEDNNIAKGRK